MRSWNAFPELLRSSTLRTFVEDRCGSSCCRSHCYCESSMLRTFVEGSSTAARA